MPITIKMPALSPTMEEGTLLRWLVDEGARVEAGDIIAEIETDKAVMDVEAVDEGTLEKYLVAAGTKEIKVGVAIAIIREDGSQVEEIEVETNQSESSPTSVREQSENAEMNAQTVEGDNKASQPNGSHSTPVPTKEQSNTGDRIIASPLARKLAKEHELNLAGIAGSGPGGRIVQRDVEVAQKAGGPTVTAATAVSAKDETLHSTQTGRDDVDTLLEAGPMAQSQSLVPSQTMTSSASALSDDKVRQLYEQGAYEVIPHDAMRMIIAERLTYSKQTIPHFAITVDCRIDALLAARKRMNEGSPKEGPHAYRLSVNDFLIKALGLALQHVPAANRTWTNDAMLQHKYSDVGVAVAVEGGLYTPILHHCELKSLSELSNEMKHLAGKARARRLAPHEYQGGATSISNLGMFGVKNFDAVINPPQASILAVGSARDQPVIVNGSIEPAKIMSCSLSCDHRVIDGAVGAEFLNAFKLFIEDPVRMLV